MQKEYIMKQYNTKTVYFVLKRCFWPHPTLAASDIAAANGHTALADSNPKISIPLLEMGLEAATQKGDTEDIYRLTRRLCDLQPKNYECRKI